MIFKYTEFIPNRVDFRELGHLSNVSHWENYQNFQNLGSLLCKLKKKKIVLLWWLNETVVEFKPVLCSLNLAAIASDIEHYSATQIEPTTEMCSLWTESQVNGNHD